MLNCPRFLTNLSLLAAASLLLTACATPPTPQVIVHTQVVTQTPIVVTRLVTAAPTPTHSGVPIYWRFVEHSGSMYVPEERFIQEFNRAQDKIELISISISYNDLDSLIASGNAPDIVGPIGRETMSRYSGLFLDLEPLIDEFNYDVSDFDPALLDYYREDGKLVALPFAIFPSALFYNKDLFDQVGLAYPPQKVGDKYKLDSKEMDWTFDALAMVAKRLTLDSAGKDAAEAGFDATKIVQYGFDFQWTKDNPRWFSAYFEPHYPVKDGKLDLSEGQIAAINWYYDAMWGKEPFLPTQAAMDSDLIKGNSFNSGKVAMGLTHLWYTCCITPPYDATVTVKNWDVAVVPIYNGKTTAKMHSDTFHILKDTKHPEGHQAS